MQTEDVLQLTDRNNLSLDADRNNLSINNLSINNLSLDADRNNLSIEAEAEAEATDVAEAEAEDLFTEWVALYEQTEQMTEMQTYLDARLQSLMERMGPAMEDLHEKIDELHHACLARIRAQTATPMDFLERLLLLL